MGSTQGPDLLFLKPGDEFNGMGHSDFKILILSIPYIVPEHICLEQELDEVMTIIVWTYGFILQIHGCYVKFPVVDQFSLF